MKLTFRRGFISILAAFLILILYISTIRTKEHSTKSGTNLDRILVTEKKPETKYQTLGKALRLFKSMSSKEYQEYDNNSLESLEEMSVTIDILERMLFPWLQSNFSVYDLNKGLQKEGIVICAGNDMVLDTLTTIHMIRQIYQSHIPIQVFYAGNRDLSRENREKIGKISNVETVDITKIFNNDVLRLERWAIKPYALLASSFENVILMDADSVLLQNPKEFFNQPEYNQTGTLFFNDRSMTDEIKNWAKAREIAVELAGKMTPSLKTMRFFTSDSNKNEPRTNYQMESGIVIVNKKKHFYGLLGVCSLNFGDIRNEIYDVTYGEKESFWIGFEASGDTYSFNSHGAGVIGPFSLPADDGSKAICGPHILHLDYKGNPFWFNGSLRMIKASREPPIEAVLWAKEEPNQIWHWKHASVCLHTSNPKEFTAKEKEIISKGIEIMRQF